MIKFLLLIFSLNSVSCTSAPDLRPDVYRQADNLLELGVGAYKNDYYQRAVKYFSQAVELYQSVADVEGIDKARFNLANATLAFSDFSATKKQIDFLKQQQAQSLLSSKLVKRLLLLEVKFYFLQQDYVQALAVIKPLLSQPLNLTMLATLARLEVLNSGATKFHWLDEFQKALDKTELKSAKQQVILKRILAYVAFKKSDYEQAEVLWNQVLVYYQQQGKRRGIADCLESLAELELASGNQTRAVVLWNRALKIRLWLKDEYKVGKIRKQLFKIAKES